LHHGTGDEEVPPAFSEKLTEEIRAVGGTVEYYTYNGDNHNIANYFNLAMNRTISFFDKYLK
jgi:dipeptidyl aminopeptidase/acylaminoacyl peptidase